MVETLQRCRTKTSLGLQGRDDRLRWSLNSGKNASKQNDVFKRRVSFCGVYASREYRRIVLLVRVDREKAFLLQFVDSKSKTADAVCTRQDGV